MKNDASFEQTEVRATTRETVPREAKDPAKFRIARSLRRLLQWPWLCSRNGQVEERGSKLATDPTDRITSTQIFSTLAHITYGLHFSAF